MNTENCILRRWWYGEEIYHNERHMVAKGAFYRGGGFDTVTVARRK